MAPLAAAGAPISWAPSSARGVRRKISVPSAARGLPLGRLHYLLGRLAPEKRRVVIMKQLTETQRLALERWIVQRQVQAAAVARGIPPRRITKKPQSSAPCERTLGAHMWHCSEGGFRAEVHLGRGLYVLPALCEDLTMVVGTLARLLRLRERIRRALPAKSSFFSSENTADMNIDAKLFEWRVSTALREDVLIGNGATTAPQLFLRSRISIARGLRLSSPLRAVTTEAAVALNDWRLLAGATRGESFLSDDIHQVHLGNVVFVGRCPEAAAQQWARTCEVWLAMWSKRGKSHRRLQAQLAAMNAVWRPAWARAARRWQLAQASVTRQVAHLLEAHADRDLYRLSLPSLPPRRSAKRRRIDAAVGGNIDSSLHGPAWVPS